MQQWVAYVAKMIALLAIWKLCVLGALFSSLWMLVSIPMRSPRAWLLALSFDQLVNTAWGGDPDETISSRAARGARLGIWRYCVLCRLLDLIDRGHCERSVGQ